MKKNDNGWKEVNNNNNNKNWIIIGPFVEVDLALKKKEYEKELNKKNYYDDDGL